MIFYLILYVYVCFFIIRCFLIGGVIIYKVKVILDKVIVNN